MEGFYFLFIAGCIERKVGKTHLAVNGSLFHCPKTGKKANCGQWKWVPLPEKEKNP
ncbi:hypothetical protein AM1BK_42800 [Neobacillus kokaensis]|uniref:Uncharacterized protein n=1 Tax=Neobacillus kokaensis TaxID=2759023 RepID=A0ABQ3NA04_9BACI|nr:hypothetical protein AM1BK_42800 [Neobacillus kokaensis]